MTQPHGHSFRRYLAVSFFQFTKLLAKYVSYVPSQMHRPLRDGLENTCIPNESCGDRKRLGHRAMTVLNTRSEEHTSELQSPMYLVCRLLLEKKKPVRPGSATTGQRTRTPAACRDPPTSAQVDRHAV